MWGRRTAVASLEHGILYPERAKPSYATIVALHGRGADARDLLPIVRFLGLDDVLVIAPRAPLSLNLGMVQGYAWYEMNQVGEPHTETFHRSLETLRKFVAEIKQGYPVDPQRLILLGFSQGAVMAYAACLVDPSAVRAIVALSGYVPLKLDLQFRLDKLKSLPVFISHGTYDEIIPVKFGRESAELLKQAGADVVYREYPMGHEVRVETLRDLKSWTKSF